MRHNHTTLTALEIERVRKAIEHYAKEYMGTVRYIVIEELDNRDQHYDFIANCLIYLDGDREFYSDGLREEHELVGINRTNDGGFEVPID